MRKDNELQDKLNKLSEIADNLSGEDGMIELDPENPKHKEWFEEDQPPIRTSEKSKYSSNAFFFSVLLHF